MSGTIEVTSREPALIDVVIGGAPVVVNESGLPFPPWTQGTHGDVVATVDDPTTTALTIAAMAAQTADLWDVKDENGLKLLAMEPRGHIIHRVHAWPSFSNQPAYQLVTEELAADAIDTFEIYSVDAGLPLFALDSSGGVESQLQSINSQFFIKDAATYTRAENQFGASFPQAEIQQALRIQAKPGQTFPFLRLLNVDLSADVMRVLMSGAIGTSAGEPADGDINPGECFRYFIPTNGAAKVGFKAKTLDGTVVKREDAIP